jgi:hypothetical protein
MLNIFCLVLYITVLLILIRFVYKDSLPDDDMEAAISLVATTLLFCFFTWIEFEIKKILQKFQNQDEN